MFFKKFKKTSILFLLTLFIMPHYVQAYSDFIYAGGENIGIEIKTNGVIVIGSYEVNGKSLAKEAGLEKGDIIKQVDSQNVSSIDEMVKKINATKENKLKLTYLRKSKLYHTNLKLVKENNIYKTGLYVKDKVTGIGTLTFIDPKSKTFGALGHEVLESNTGTMLEVKDGKIFKSSVTSIDKSREGNPGSKNASLDKKDQTGKIKENTSSGIYGKYTEKILDKKLYKVATIEDIKIGPAKILTVINGTDVKEFDVEILKLKNNRNEKTKNLLLKITDKELLNKTGGVVQGMSGSPIIQGDFIIGAVTHVVVDDPQKGYGIFITNMLEESEE